MNPIPTKTHPWRAVTVFQLLVGFLVSLSAVGQPEFLKEGLVAYYPFNGNGDDISQSNAKVLNNSELRFAQDRFGTKNAAFASNKDCVAIIPFSRLPAGNGDRTVSLWLNVSDYPTGLESIWWGGSESYNKSWLLHLTGIGITDRGGPGILRVDNYGNSIPGAPVVVVDGNWRHIIWVLKSSKSIFYINGNKTSEFDFTTDTAYSKAQIGGAKSIIDDFRIYNRALSDAEVKSLYAYESTPPDNSFITNGLVAYYPFNGNANDESGNQKNGTSIGATLGIDRFGVANKSYYFDGGDYIEIPDKRLLDKQQNVAISAWYRFQDNQGGQIFSAADYRGGDDPIHIYIEPTRLTAVNFGDTVQDGWFPSPSLQLINTNQVWHQIVIVLDGANNQSSLRVYQDGKIVASTNRSSGFQITYDRDMSALIGAIEGRPFYSTPSQFWKGWLDDLRVYDRSLSDTEVKALYDYESTPQPLNPRVASATAQVVNGFIVGATITDAGYGYVENPTVTITGGGGTGAKAIATQFNGVVTSITITNPGVGYTSAPTITIAPPPFPPRKATSTAQIINGFVVGTKITDGGFGYDSPPAVLLVGGGGSGATAVATVANGVVIAITITNPGTGYTSAPVVRIASPPFAPKLGIETSKVYVRMSVVLGRKYQLEASTDLSTWTTTGPAFIAQDEELAQEFDVNQVGRYFRINQVP